MPAAHSSRLSRRVLWGIIFLYMLPGLFARSPWTPDDAVGFGLAQQLLSQPFSEWAVGHIGDRMYAEDGMLSAWVSALLAMAAQAAGLPLRWLDDAMRLGNVVWLILAGWAIWNTTYRLARRAELQPEDPFGAAPTRVDYARAVADASVLCFLSTLGLLVRSHFQVPELAELAGISLMLLAAVRALDRPLGAGWMLGWGIALAFFARGWAHLAPFLGMLLLSAATHPALRFGLVQRLGRASLVAGGLILLWFVWLMSTSKGPGWWDQYNHWNLTRYLAFDPQESLGRDDGVVTLKVLAWFFWPTLPLAVWSAWRYRKAIAEPAIRIPLAGVAAGLAVLLVTNPSDEANYIPLVGPMAVLAAIGLSTLRRSLTALIDWFAMLTFTLLAFLVWLGWSAATFGLPERMARNFEKLSPGYVPTLTWIEIVIAVLATVAWIRLVMWRTGKSSQAGAVWRPMVLSSGGVTLIWLLLMTLWIPRIDYAKSYSAVGVELAKQVHAHGGESACVIDQDLNLGQRAVLQYHSGLSLVWHKHTNRAKQCQFALLEDQVRSGMPKRTAFLNSQPNSWEVVWEGGRNSDRKERLVLLKRKVQTAG